MPHRVGYCCINTQLNKSGITTGRTMRKATFEAKGLKYASELALKNVDDLLRILKWNHDKHMKLFRMGSGLIPWATEYDITDLPDYDAIAIRLQTAGTFARLCDHRITAHPDHFVKLASANPTVVANSIKELELHSHIFDLMGLTTTHYNAINIHVGMNFSVEVADRWCAAFHTLSPNLRNRLVVENDDKPNGFSVRKLWQYVTSNNTDVPITFDYFHHQLHSDGMSTEDAARLAYVSWPSGVTPLFHYSESKRLNESVDCNATAHADYVFNKINDYGLTLDIDLEAKAKELAVIKYRSL